MGRMEFVESSTTVVLNRYCALRGLRKLDYKSSNSPVYGGHEKDNNVWNRPVVELQYA